MSEEIKIEQKEEEKFKIPAYLRRDYIELLKSELRALTYWNNANLSGEYGFIKKVKNNISLLFEKTNMVDSTKDELDDIVFYERMNAYAMELYYIGGEIISKCKNFNISNIAAFDGIRERSTAAFNEILKKIQENFKP